jgi:hypothetical protein|nr:MAG TPA: hypothetical protein [Caudoviricetes sp.]
MCYKSELLKRLGDLEQEIELNKSLLGRARLNITVMEKKTNDKGDYDLLLEVVENFMKANSSKRDAVNELLAAMRMGEKTLADLQEIEMSKDEYKRLGHLIRLYKSSPYKSVDLDQEQAAIYLSIIEDKIKEAIEFTKGERSGEAKNEEPLKEEIREQVMDEKVEEGMTDPEAIGEAADLVANTIAESLNNKDLLNEAWSLLDDFITILLNNLRRMIK